MLKYRIAAIAAAIAAPVFAQYPAYYPGQVQAAPPYSIQLTQLVQPIALYPDPLLAQVLTASTYWNEIPEAAAWADQDRNAVYAENAPWDPSIVALLPYPSVLDMMAQDPGWTQALGNAVLANRDAVMDAVQQVRQTAAQPSYVYVPGYNPAVGVSVGISYRAPVRVAPREEHRQAMPEYRRQPEGGRSEAGRYRDSYAARGGRDEGGHGERGDHR